ncbi:hypothetical protein, conserved [Eimeria tenella]|uniref:Uncharacterized protein n=1 Tax=Eimeria tenella TaxID=5802 RepID=U6KKP6_EIMTE|nr:hypothetical protein, conserved [Eimeria tenella]CDJ38494.1 hypothetical protein, conserved [Eimeria tenella]|eukprot:XP_013229332.1 hypothetical protein, conserved [Eimeria tenella]
MSRSSRATHRGPPISSKGLSSGKLGGHFAVQTASRLPDWAVPSGAPRRSSGVVGTSSKVTQPSDNNRASCSSSINGCADRTAHISSGCIVGAKTSLEKKTPRASRKREPQLHPFTGVNIMQAVECLKESASGNNSMNFPHQLRSSQIEDSPASPANKVQEAQTTTLSGISDSACLPQGAGSMSARRLLGCRGKKELTSDSTTAPEGLPDSFSLGVICMGTAFAPNLQEDCTVRHSAKGMPRRSERGGPVSTRKNYDFAETQEKQYMGKGEFERSGQTVLPKMHRGSTSLILSLPAQVDRSEALSEGPTEDHESTQELPVVSLTSSSSRSKIRTSENVNNSYVALAGRDSSNGISDKSSSNGNSNQDSNYCNSSNGNSCSPCTISRLSRELLLKESSGLSLETREQLVTRGQHVTSGITPRGEGVVGAAVADSFEEALSIPSTTGYHNTSPGAHGLKGCRAPALPWRGSSAGTISGAHSIKEHKQRSHSTSSSNSSTESNAPADGSSGNAPKVNAQYIDSRSSNCSGCNNNGDSSGCGKYQTNSPTDALASARERAPPSTETLRGLPKESATQIPRKRAGRMKGSCEQSPSACLGGWKGHQSCRGVRVPRRGAAFGVAAVRMLSALGAPGTIFRPDRTDQDGDESPVSNQSNTETDAVLKKDGASVPQRIGTSNRPSASLGSAYE